MNPSCSSRRTRAYVAGDERPTCRARSALLVRPSACKIFKIAQSMSSSSSIPKIISHLPRNDNGYSVISWIVERIVRRRTTELQNYGTEYQESLTADCRLPTADGLVSLSPLHLVIVSSCLLTLASRNASQKTRALRQVMAAPVRNRLR